MTTPNDRLTEFSNAWNDLRNAVVGRGTEKPANVPQELYAKVSNTYDRWRTYLQSLPAVLQVFPLQPISDWVLEYRDLATEAQKAGLTFNVLPVSWLESVKATATDVQTTAKALAKTTTGMAGVLVASLFLAAVPVIALAFSGSRRR
jgi:hypothetical protein